MSLRYLNAVLVRIEEPGAFWGSKIRARPEHLGSGRVAPESDEQKSVRLQNAAKERRAKARAKAEAAVAFDLRRWHYSCEDAGGTEVVPHEGNRYDAYHSNAILEVLSRFSVERKVVPPILFGAEDSALFEAFLDRFARLPVETAAELLKEGTQGSTITVDHATLVAIARYDAGEREVMSVKTRSAYDDLQTALNIVNGIFTEECGFYSQPDESTILCELTRDQVSHTPEDYALVFLLLRI